MWPFKRKESQPRETIFLISEEAQKQHIKEHMLFQLLNEHMEENRYGELVLPRIWVEAIPKAMEEGFDKAWDQALASYTTANLGTKYQVYVVPKK